MVGVGKYIKIYLCENEKRIIKCWPHAIGRFIDASLCEKKIVRTLKTLYCSIKLEVCSRVTAILFPRMHSCHIHILVYNVKKLYFNWIWHAWQVQNRSYITPRARVYVINFTIYVCKIFSSARYVCIWFIYVYLLYISTTHMCI